MYRTILRHLRRSTAGTTPIASLTHHYPNHLPHNPNYLLSCRSYAFSSAEEAAAERRRRKRRLRIEPPLFALRRDPSNPPPNRDNQTGPRLPDSTSALVGPRLNIHNRVQSLIRAGDLDSGAAIARHAVFSNVRPTVFTCNAIIAAMYRAGRYNDSKILFQYFFTQSEIIPNIVSYNSLIQAHCGSGDVDEAMKVYHRIIEEAPFSPSHFTYRYLTKGLIDAGRIQDAVDLLREMLNKGQGADSLVYNNLISGFLELGNLDKAKEFFEELQERCTVFDGVVSATFMDWYFKQGREKEAMDAYKYLMDKQFRMVPATCNVLLEVLLRHGREKEAQDLFDNMLDNHTPPTFQAVNSDTFNIMVNECFRSGKVTEAMEVFKKAGKAVKSRPFAMDVAGFNNMIIRMCELDMTAEAEDYLAQLLGKSLSPDVTSYRTLIDAYIKADKVDEALDKYTKMVEAGLRVIPAYANKWFGFLIEKGKVKECVPILTKMAEREPKPDFTTYDIVIKGLCGVGELNTCCDVVGVMIAVGVNVTPPLKDYLFSVYEKEGRRGDIERIVNARFPLYAPPRPSPQNDHKPWLPSPSTRTPLQASTAPQEMPLQGSVSPQFPAQTASSGASRLPWQGSAPLQSSTGATQNLAWQSAPPTRQSFHFPAQTTQSGASEMSWQGSVPAQSSSVAPQNTTWQGSVPAQSSSVAPQNTTWQASAPLQTSSGAPQNTTWQASHPHQYSSGAPQNTTWQVSAPLQSPSGAPQNSTWQASHPHQYSAGAQQGQWQASYTAQGPEQVSRPSQAPWQTSNMHQSNPATQQAGWHESAPPQAHTSGSAYMSWQGSAQAPGQPGSAASSHNPWQPSAAASSHNSWQQTAAPSQVTPQMQSPAPQTEWQGLARFSGQPQVSWEDPHSTREAVGSSQMPWQGSHSN